MGEEGQWPEDALGRTRCDGLPVNWGSEFWSIWGTNHEPEHHIVKYKVHDFNINKVYQFKSGAEYLSKEYQKSFSAGKEIKDRAPGTQGWS